MADKLDVKQGTLALMILKTLEVLGPLHGYGIGRRIEETSKNRLTLNYGTLYPALLKLEQEGLIKAEWRQSENDRRAKYYALTAAGHKQLAREARDWHRTADLIAAFLGPRWEVLQQLLNGGLLDEISVDIPAILLGSGVRLFDHLAGMPAVLGNPTVIQGVGVTHLPYPVRKA